MVDVVVAALRLLTIARAPRAVDLANVIEAQLAEYVEDARRVVIAEKEVRGAWHVAGAPMLRPWALGESCRPASPLVACAFCVQRSSIAGTQVEQLQARLNQNSEAQSRTQALLERLT